jgi:N-acyl-D-amino-acid deacylase
MVMMRHWSFAAALLVLAGCGPRYDVIIRGGTIYDGSGGEPLVGDVAIAGDTIAAVGTVTGRGRMEVDATGMAVAPGFINMLSHSEETLIQDPKGQSEIRQGVTLEIFGEGSMGPLSDAMKKEFQEQQGDIKYPIEWTTLGEYFDFLTRRGIATNVASFVGASTVRVHVIGYQNRAPTAPELERMKELVAQAMDEGALGVTTALIYTPATFARTDELVELAKVASEAGGIYAAHIRSEGDRFLEAIDETIQIAADAAIPAEIYHLKAAGNANWPRMDLALTKIDSARAAGLKITADMYTYTAGATGLDAAMPPWVQEGGLQAWIGRLKNPAIRRRVAREMRTPSTQWENLYLGAGSPDQVLLLGFKTDSLKALTGKTLANVARMRGKSAEETAMDLVIQDGTRVEVAYFLMSEDNIKKQIAQPWVSFGSDAGSQAPEGAFLKSNPHPRAYGNFARLLGKYVRDEQVIPVQEAVRRLTSLPAEVLRLQRRGALKPGHYADVVVFDAANIQDHATFEKPHQYATGVLHVFVNGQHVLKDGEHTGVLAGRIVRGQAWKPDSATAQP